MGVPGASPGAATRADACRMSVGVGSSRHGGEWAGVLRGVLLVLCVAASACKSSAGGALPAGWHRRQLASGQAFYISDDEPGVVKWSLPEPQASPAAVTVAEREVPDSGHHRLHKTGQQVVATLAEGGRQLVRVARAHDEGYAGGISYTVTTASGHHRRLPQYAVQEGVVQFESPKDGAVLVAAPREHPTVNLSTTLSSAHLQYGQGQYQLCIELFGSPLLRQTDGTPRVDPASYEAAGAFESMSVGCFDELQPLELSDLPPGRFRLLASIHATDDQHLPNATIDITVLSEADTHVVASYEWQRMEPWQSAGAGLEVNQSSSTLERFVRIPPRWEFDLSLIPSAFGTLSLEVESSTNVDVIHAGARKLVEEIASVSPQRRCAPGHIHRIELSLDGTALTDGEETVSSLDLWRRRASLRVQVSSCEESPELQKIKDFVKRRLEVMDVIEHHAHTLPPEPDPGFPLPTEAHAKLRLQASLARWAAREREKLIKK